MSIKWKLVGLVVAAGATAGLVALDRIARADTYRLRRTHPVDPNPMAHRGLTTTNRVMADRAIQGLH